jgi:hypothetical protein
MGKLVRMTFMGFLLALTLYSVPFADASARRKPTASTKATCRVVGICSQSCYSCISNQGCPDYPSEVCLCGQHICP